MLPFPMPPPWVADMLAIAEAAAPHLRRAGQQRWLKDLENHDIHDFPMALDWAVRQEDKTAALRLAGALWPFWFIRDCLDAALEWLPRALAGADDADARLRAVALHGLGVVTTELGERAAALPLLEQALALAGARRDDPLAAAILESLGALLLRERRHAEAETQFRLSLAMRVALADGEGGAATLLGLAANAFARDDAAAARRCLREAEAAYPTPASLQLESAHQCCLAEAALAEGDAARAWAAARAALERSFALACPRLELMSLDRLAAAAAAMGQDALAARLYGAASAFAARRERPWDHLRLPRHGQWMARARTGAGAESWQRQWAIGERLSPGGALLLVGGACG